jgi:choline dehydrogenase-like flavoprotein
MMRGQMAVAVATSEPVGSRFLGMLRFERRWLVRVFEELLPGGSMRVPGVGPVLMKQLADYGHLAIFGVQVRARAKGRVRRGAFGRASIAYDLTDEDVRSLKMGVKRLTQMMFAAGAREVLPGVFGLPERITKPDEIEPIFDLPDDPRRFHCIASHLFGTARMGPTPQTGVVNPALESHELAGLYVVDSSVFPTNMGVNPQHTICAVSWLAAERIASR